MKQRVQNQNSVGLKVHQNNPGYGLVWTTDGTHIQLITENAWQSLNNNETFLCIHASGSDPIAISLVY